MSDETPASALPAVPEKQISEDSGVWSARGPVRIAFEATPKAPCCLVVTSPSDWPVAAQVYRRLFDNRVQVIHVEVRKVDGDRRLEHRLHLVEFDGAPLPVFRQRTIAEDLVSLLDDFSVEYESGVSSSKAPI